MVGRAGRLVPLAWFASRDFRILGVSQPGKEALGGGLE